MNLGVIAPAGAENEITNGLKRKPALRETSKREEGARENECFPVRCINERTHSPSEAPASSLKKLCPRRLAELFSTAVRVHGRYAGVESFLL